MKTLYIGDLHFGVKNGNQMMLDYQLEYLCGEVMVMIYDNNVNTVVLLGDIFDVRRYTNTVVLDQIKRRFFDELERNNIEVIMLCGNHDTVFKNTLFPNSLDTNLSHYSNIKIITKPTEMIIGGVPTLAVPWICRENEDECIDVINASVSRNCIGHFEIVGADMGGGTCTAGLPQSLFAKFDHCLSGHFHLQGNYSNIQYVGTPYELSWMDYGSPKGVWLHDCQTNVFRFIENTDHLFYKIIYNDDHDMFELLRHMHLRDKYVKIIVERREDFNAFERWMLEYNQMGALETRIVEPLMIATGGDEWLDKVSCETVSTTDLMLEYIEDTYPERKEKLSDMMLSLYNEAMIGGTE